MNTGKTQVLCVALLAVWTITSPAGSTAETKPAATEGVKSPAPAATSTPLPAGVEELRYEGGLLTLKAEGADLRSLLAAIAKATGVEIAVQHGVAGRVSARVAGVSVEEGMKAILSGGVTAGYGAEFARKEGEGSILQRVLVLRKETADENAAAGTTHARKPAVVREVFVRDIDALYRGGPDSSANVGGYGMAAYDVTVADAAGRVVLRVGVPLGGTHIVYGTTVAQFPYAMHAPAVDYYLRLAWPGGEKTIEKPGRLLNVRALGDVLFVQSTDQAGDWRNEIFDSSGDLLWAPPGNIMAIQRHGDLIHITTDVAAREQQRPRTAWIRWNVKTRATARVDIRDGLTPGHIVLVDGDARVLLFDDQTIAFVDAEAPRELWVAPLPRWPRRGKAEWVPNLGRAVTTVGGRIPVVVQEVPYEAVPGPRKPITVAYYEISTGEVVAHELLYETGESVPGVQRLRRPTGELLVFPNRAFEISGPEVVR